MWPSFPKLVTHAVSPRPEHDRMINMMKAVFSHGSGGSSTDGCERGPSFPLIRTHSRGHNIRRERIPDSNHGSIPALAHASS